jgi:uncharacterized protein (TIGR02145 family)
MKKTALLIMLILFYTIAFTQDITISFQPKVSGTTIDSVVVLNQRTGQKVKLIGNESLTLTKVTSVNDIPFTSFEGLLYPNPCIGRAEVNFATTMNQEVKVSVYNMSGQLLNTKSQFLMPGQHRFKIYFPENGIYNVTVLKNDGSLSSKAVCMKPEVTKCGIDYTGTDYKDLIKNAVVGKTLSYAQGDILNCSAYSGKNNTIIADSPTTTKIYLAEFYVCKDPENQSYPIVKIGEQWWMAKNLQTTKYMDGTAIPNITDNSSWAGKTTGAYCWINNDAATYQNLYGALYNWYAVSTGKLCPTGWHVPTDAEWTTLENYLIGNGYNFDGTITGNKIAKSLATQYGWESYHGAGTPGNTDYPAYRNKSGFSGLPGGYRDNGYFTGVGLYNYWWSSTKSTEYPTYYAWFRYIACDYTFVYRNIKYMEEGYSVRCVRDN